MSQYLSVLQIPGEENGGEKKKKKGEATSCTQHQHAESHAAFMVKHLRIMVNIKIVLLCDADIITALPQQ